MNEGDKIGAYQLGELLGRGGMASVFRAYHEADGTPVALKVLHPRVASQEALVEGFSFEIRTAAALNHPRITAIYDHGILTEHETMDREEEAGIPWLAMEVVDGGTLTSLRGRVSWTELRSVVLDVLEALAHAHAHGLVHRDIKPGNVLLDKQTRRVKLTDFGLVLSSHDMETASGRGTAVIGTPTYMAPEQIRGEPRSYGPWTDLYAVGIMTWGLACGTVPFVGELLDLFQQHLGGELPAFRPRRTMPAALVDWIETMVAIDPHERFQCAADAAQALRSLPELAMIEAVQQAPVASFEDATQTTIELATRTLQPQAIESLSLLDAGSQPVLRSDRPRNRKGHLPLVCARTAFPEDWREGRRTRVHLHGAGLALFSLRTSGVVGRERAQDHLWSTLGAVVRERTCRFVLVEGASGSGKSMLARWLGVRSSELGLARWMSIDHPATGGDGDGIASFLARLLRIDGLDRVAAVEAVREQLGHWRVSSLEDAVGLVQLAMPVDAAEMTTGLFAHFANARERWTLVTRLLAAIADDRPLVLWFDELHLDTECLSLAENLLATLHDVPLLIIGTVSSEDVPRETPIAERLDAIAAHPASARLELESLDAGGMVAMIRDLLGLDIALATALEQRCGGNPQFAVQLVAGWVERGLLEPSDSGFKLRDGAEIAIPKNMLSLWRQRLESVVVGRRESSLFALEVGATLGVEVQREEWEDVQALEDVQPCPNLMSELQRRRLIMFSHDGQRWSFAHALFHAAVLDHAERAGRRVRWANAAVDVLPDGRQSIARRARLLVAADRTEEALRPLASAILGETMLEEYGRAEQLFEIRAAILQDFEVDPRGSHALGTEVCQHFLLRNVDRYAAIRSYGAGLIARAERWGEWEYAARLILDLGLSTNDWVECKPLLERSLAIAREHRLPLVSYILNKMCYLSGRAGLLDEAVRYGRQAIYEAERQGDLLGVGSAYQNLGEVSLHKGNHGRARFYTEEARDRFEQVGSHSGLAAAYHVDAELERHLGNHQAAEKAYLEAAARYRSCGSSNHYYADLNVALLRCETRRFPEARAMLEPLRKRLEDHSSRSLVPWIRLCLTTCLAHERRWSELADELGAVDVLLRERKLYEKDAALVASICTELCLDAGEAPLARKAWRIAQSQLDFLGLPTAFAAVSARIDSLPQ